MLIKNIRKCTWSLPGIFYGTDTEFIDVEILALIKPDRSNIFIFSSPLPPARSSIGRKDIYQYLVYQ